MYAEGVEILRKNYYRNLNIIIHNLFAKQLEMF